MARTKIALLHCEQPHEGPWLRPQGDERGVRVYPELTEGEEVIMELDQLDGLHPVSVSDGFTFLPLAQALRYRACKLGSGSPTNVEVVSDG